MTRINSVKEINNYRAVSSNLTDISTRIKQIGLNLGNNTDDKSLKIVEQKLHEISNSLNTISTNLSTFSGTILSVTDKINQQLEQEERKKQTEENNTKKEEKEKTGFFSRIKSYFGS